MKKNLFLRRTLVFGVLIAALIASVAIICILVHIASYRVEYADYLFSGRTVYADQVYAQRLALGRSGGLTGFLYNLPFFGKLFTLAVASITAYYSAYGIKYLTKYLVWEKKQSLGK